VCNSVCVCVCVCVVLGIRASVWAPEISQCFIASQILESFTHVIVLISHTSYHSF